MTKSKSSLSAKGKLLIAYSMAGIAFAILTTLSIAIVNGTIGLNFDNNVQGMISALFSGDGMATVLTIITAIIFGVFIWIFSYIGALVKAKIIGGKTVKLQARPHIVGLLAMGFFGVAILGIVDQILAGVGTSTDPTGLIAFGNPVGIAVQFIFYSVLGFTVIWLGSKFQALEKPLPDALKKI